MGRAEAELVEETMIGARFAGGWAKIKCPFCIAEGHDSKKNNLHISTRGYYQCWRCGETGWVKLDGLPSAATEAPKPELEHPTFDPPDGFEYLDGDESSTLAPARRYLASRGITDEAIQALRIGACGASADWMWKGRVVVPHLSEDGRAWFGWVGRIWIAKPRKNVMPYLYPAGMRRTLFNAHVLAEKTDEPCLGFEGALDVAHYPERAFAFFGSPTEDHIREIERKANRPVVIVLDGDMPDKCDALGMRLRFDGLRAGAVVLPPLMDPDEVPRDWLLEEARRAIR